MLLLSPVTPGTQCLQGAQIAAGFSGGLPSGVDAGEELRGHVGGGILIRIHGGGSLSSALGLALRGWRMKIGIPPHASRNYAYPRPSTIACRAPRHAHRRLTVMTSPSPFRPIR